MQIKGEMLIGDKSRRGEGKQAYGFDPSAGARLEPAFCFGTADDVSQAADLAWRDFDDFREASLDRRARLLEAIADEIADLGDLLINRALQETGLPRNRLEGERARTIGQLHMFAEAVRAGGFEEPRLDPAAPERTPIPRPDLRLRHVPLGPVAVFGASNFPLAFSVAGGDTASALAAGCPVIAKAHMAHPGVCELVGRAIQAAVAKSGAPEGVFSLLFGGNEMGAALVAHKHIKAVGFTGSRLGGLALVKIAARRPEPIPVYAEMSSINPVFLLNGALKSRGVSIARGFVASLTLGAGQFCTNPGLVLAQDGDDLQPFIESVKACLDASPAATQLTSDIHAAYEEGVSRLEAHPKVTVLGRGRTANAGNQAQAVFCSADSAAFLDYPVLAEEVFGPASLLVRCRDVADMRALAERLEGQLTATLQMEESDIDDARRLMPVLERKVGRILVNGFPTGVEVSHAMVHGGPYPSTADGRSTSVGTLAIRRFLRPICYQDVPQMLLPPALRDAQSPWAVSPR
jgi:NADP-dependent aldehyde dehydrogenase